MYVAPLQIDALLAELTENMGRLDQKLNSERLRQMAVRIYLLLVPYHHTLVPTF